MAPPPAFVPPQLATTATHAPAGPEWLYEIKYDGYRVQLRLQDGAVSLLTRNGHDWTDRFGGVPQAARVLQAETAVIDGEMVVLDERGVSSFARLKAALGDRAAERLVFYAFDLLHLDGQDLQPLPLLERKRQLDLLLAPLPPDHLVRFSAHLIGNGPRFTAMPVGWAWRGLSPSGSWHPTARGAKATGSRSSATPGRSSSSAAIRPSGTAASTWAHCSWASNGMAYWPMSGASAPAGTCAPPERCWMHSVRWSRIDRHSGLSR